MFMCRCTFLTLHLPDADEIKGTYTQTLNGLPKYWGGGGATGVTIRPPQPSLFIMDRKELGEGVMSSLPRLGIFGPYRGCSCAYEPREGAAPVIVQPSVVHLPDVVCGV